MKYSAYFIVYLFAMIGFITTAVLVYKKSTNLSIDEQNKNYLKVENTLRLNPTKTIYIIKAGYERFLIAGDSANTTLLSKLDKDNVPEPIEIQENFQENNALIPQLKDLINKINRG